MDAESIMVGIIIGSAIAFTISAFILGRHRAEVDTALEDRAALVREVIGLRDRVKHLLTERSLRDKKDLDSKCEYFNDK
jgi:hypothetical protein